MKTNFFLMLIPAAMILLFAQCSLEIVKGGGDEPVDPSIDKTDLPVRIIAGLPETRLSSSPSNPSKWENGDLIGVFMTDQSSLVVPGSENVPYKATNVQGTTATFVWVKDSILFPNDPNKEVKFLAYYPYSATEVTGLDYTITMNSEPQKMDSLGKFDVLWNNVVSKTFKKTFEHIPLVFEHVMTMLVFHIKDESQTGCDFLTDSPDMKITNMHDKGTLKLTSGNIQGGNSFIDIHSALRTVDSKSAEAVAIVVPVDNSSSTSNIEIVFTVGSIPPFTSKLPPVDGSYSLKKGKRYTYDVKLRDRMVIIEGSISDWETVEGPPINPN
jgi:hypothetical protein